MVACVRVHGEVTHFIILCIDIVTCKSYFWLMWCKNYRNWLQFAKVIAKKNVVPPIMEHSVVYIPCLFAFCESEE